MNIKGMADVNVETVRHLTVDMVFSNEMRFAFRPKAIYFGIVLIIRGDHST